MFPILQLATLAGPLAGEELHGLCFLVEKVEITEDCLGGTGHGSAAAAAAGLPPPPPASEIAGSSGDGSAVSPVVSSVVLDADGGVSSSTAVNSVNESGGGHGARGGRVGVDVVGNENDTDDNASVGQGSVKSGATGSTTGGRREPRQV